MPGRGVAGTGALGNTSGRANAVNCRDNAAAVASGVLPGSFAMVENTVPGTIGPDQFGFRFGKPGLAADTLSK